MARLAFRVRAALLSVLLLAGCAAGAPMTTPMPAGTEPATSPVDATGSCSGTIPGAQPTSYPGWPGQSSELVPIPVSTELAQGRSRFLLNLLDNANEPLASPDRRVRLAFFDLATDPATPEIEIDAAYLPTTDELPGLYRAEVEFPCWGEWGVEAVASEADGTERAGRMIFPVRQRTSTPAIGEAAPASETPTAETNAEIAAISTDDDPAPFFYATSIDAAVAAERPFLVIFSTPAFCRTRTCGPALDIVKAVAPEFDDDVTFIHVEPYELEVADGNLQPVLSAENQPIPVAAVNEWRLPTEPYIFVVDGDGLVAAKLEGVASEDEIRQALEAVTQGG